MPKILMYHSIGETPKQEPGAEFYCVPEDKFRQQMKYIVTQNAKSKTQNGSIAITFDDGDITNYERAYPVLKELGLKAYFFILVSKVGAAGYMNWEQIKELRDAGMFIGSHGMTHRILTELKDGDLDYEIKDSKKFLEDNLYQPVEYFSVPRGFYNKRIIEKVKEAGYKGVFTSNPNDNNGFLLGRIAVRGDWDLDYFVKVINNGSSIRDNIGEKLKKSAKRILGAKNYDKVRTVILGNRS